MNHSVLLFCNITNKKCIFIRIKPPNMNFHSFFHKWIDQFISNYFHPFLSKTTKKNRMVFLEILFDIKKILLFKSISFQTKIPVQSFLINIVVLQIWSYLIEPSYSPLR